MSRVMHGGRGLGVMGVTSVGESRRERQSGWGRWVGVVKKEEWWVGVKERASQMVVVPVDLERARASHAVSRVMHGVGVARSMVRGSLGVR